MRHPQQGSGAGEPGVRRAGVSCLVRRTAAERAASSPRPAVLLVVTFARALFDRQRRSAHEKEANRARATGDPQGVREPLSGKVDAVSDAWRQRDAHAVGRLLGSEPSRPSGRVGNRCGASSPSRSRSCCSASAAVCGRWARCPWRPANSGCSLTSVVAPMSFHAARSSWLSLVGTRSGSMKSAPHLDRQRVGGNRVLGAIRRRATMTDHKLRGTASGMTSTVSVCRRCRRDSECGGHSTATRKRRPARKSRSRLIPPFGCRHARGRYLQPPK